MRIPVKSIVIGTSRVVDLPEYDHFSYAWEEQSRLPSVAELAKIAAGTPLDGFADVPDRILDDVSHRPHKGKIRKLYQGQSWDNDQVGDDV